MHIIGRLAVLTTAISTVIVSSAGAGGHTTADRTICDHNADNRLEYCQPDTRILRQDLGEVRRDKAVNRQPLVNIAHLSDLHFTDPESPLHMEFADPFIPSADRPQQEAEPFVMEAMAQQLRGMKSPITGRRLDFAVEGGDLADSDQYNETRGGIDTLDGGFVKTDSGLMGIDHPCSWPWLEKGSNYAGPRGSSLFWEPDSSEGGVDGPGYSPNADENLKNAGTNNAVPDFPGFLEAANAPFHATGLDVPWYAIYGNHDALIVGNFSPDTRGKYEELNGIATGCLRIMPKDKKKRAVRSLLHLYKKFSRKPTGSIRKSLVRKIQRVFDEKKNPYHLTVVPDDPDRRLLTREQAIDEFSNTTTKPRGHGFEAIPSKLKEKDRAYYAVSPKPGIVLIGLDTTNSCQLWNGSVDDAQFKQLDRDLGAAEDAGKIAIVFGHHTLKTINNGLSCRDREEPVHFGLKGERGKPRHRRSESLEELFLRHPNVLFYVSGHEHRAKILSYKRKARPGRFYEITTPSHIDSPSQARLIELVNNRDCSFSVYTTMVDHAAEPDPGPSPDLSSPLALASIHRLVAENDPQKDPSAYGLQKDRNTELVIRVNRRFCSKFRRLQLSLLRDGLQRGSLPGISERSGDPGISVDRSGRAIEGPAKGRTGKKKPKPRTRKGHVRGSVKSRRSR